MISYNEPAVTELRTGSIDKSGVRVTVLHENYNNPHVSGNKWWKLRNNLEQAKKEGHKTLLTFGGAYSNHIYATAAAAKEEGFKSVGIIRGEEVVNSTLEFARAQGMRLIFVTRELYGSFTRDDSHPQEILSSLRNDFGDYYLIPEGGTNQYAVTGCKSWGAKLKNIDFDQLYLPVGTGGTISGLICGLDGEREIIGVPVLRNTGFLESDIKTLTKSNSDKDYSNWRLLNNYHHGGYAKAPVELKNFCELMKEYKLTVEPVYTGKLFWALFDQIENGLVKRGTTILAIHTGGLQVLNS